MLIFRGSWKRLPRLLWAAAAISITVFALMSMERKAALMSLKSVAEILAELCLACFAASVLEHRAWLRFVTAAAAPLIKLGRLPAPCAAAFSASFVSGSAAGLMLAESRRAGLITRAQMIFCAVCCASPASLTFSLTAMFPVIAAAGMAGAIYYMVTHGIAAVITVSFLLLLRKTSPGAAFCPRHEGRREPERWKDTFIHAWSRTRLLMTRVALVTVPLFLLTAYAVSAGVFSAWRGAVPSCLGNWLSPEALSILGARMGGMIAASGVTSEVMASGKISVVQVVFALLLGNVISNPIRTMRRSLPVALSVYPGSDGAAIALSVLGSRLILNLAVLTGIVLLFS